MRQQKVSSARETSQTEFFRFAIKIFFFENKIGTHGTQILRNKFDLGQIGQKIPLPCLFLKKNLTIRQGQMSVNFI